MLKHLLKHSLNINKKKLLTANMSNFSKHDASNPIKTFCRIIAPSITFMVPMYIFYQFTKNNK